MEEFSRKPSKSDLDEDGNDMIAALEVRNSPSKEGSKIEIYDQSKYAFGSLMGNFNAALVNVLVTIPTSLSIMLALNYHAKKDQSINPTLAILTLAFGFLSSFLISGGTELFKTFTATQAFILIMQIRKFGAIGLPWTCIITGFLLFMVVLLQIESFIKLTPNCIISGLKFSTGKN